MARAIALARRGEGRVEPNPMVGCVIARSGRVLGEGFHRRFGGPHAEVVALDRCDGSPRGATMYVSLEPCAHFGKTPPCIDSLIAARVGRVVVAMLDPNPLVRGRGVKGLRKAGITVQTGLMRPDAERVLAPYRNRIVSNRPYVIAKWAQSLDGKLATRSGDSQWISGPGARRIVHRLRARVDAIMVGSGTVLADDPLLTARDVPLRRRALRAVLDSRLRVPNKCQIVDTVGDARTVILTTGKQAKSAKADFLRRRGVEVVGCRERRTQVDLPDALATLAGLGVTNLLVEGGATILTSLFELRLVDEGYVFTAPMFIGGSDAPSALRGKGSATIASATTASSVRVRRCGDDVLHHMRFDS